MLLLPVGLHDFMSAGVGLSREHRNHFAGALALVQRRNQRLNDADGAIVGAAVTPCFEIVGLVDMPVAEFRGFVLVKPEVHPERDAWALERVGESEVSGRIVGRIPAKNDQDVHLAAAHVGDQVLERLGLVHRVGVYRIGVENRLADVAERFVYGVDNGVNDCGG